MFPQVLWLSLAMLTTLQISGTSSVSIDGIAHLLEAAEGQLSDVKFSYTLRVPYYEYEKGDRARHVVLVKGVCASKTSQGLILVDSKRYTGKDEAHLRLGNDILRAYNGKTTLIWNRKEREKGVTRGVIWPGLREKEFKVDETNPYGVVWCPIGSSAKYRFPSLLTSEDWDFHIVSETERIGSLRSIHLSGTQRSKATSIEVWLCPDYGYMPLMTQWIRNSDNEILDVKHYCDYTQLENGMWFPQKIRYGESSEDGLEFENISTAPIPEEFFSPELPPNTHITDHAVGMLYLVGQTPDLTEDPHLDVSAESSAVDANAAERALNVYVAHGQEVTALDADTGSTESTTAPVLGPYFLIVLFGCAAALVWFARRWRVKVPIARRYREAAIDE